jgi:hypothetical protein
MVHANTVPNSSHAPLQTRPDAHPVPVGQASPSASAVPPELDPPELLPELVVPLELVPEEEVPDEEPELEDPDDDPELDVPDDVPPDDPPSDVRSPMPTIALHAEAPATTPSAHTTKKARCIRTSLASRIPRPSGPPAPRPTAP